MRLYKHFPPALLFILPVSLSLFVYGADAQTITRQKPSNSGIPAILVFGDSTVDPGNNDYIETATKSNFPPYGRDFPNQVPTGRFTNGRLVTDFIASYVGVKEYLPPYLDPTLSTEELMTGVSFASAGSGFDPLTAELGGVIPLQKQLEYFREYKARLELAIGKKRTEDFIKKSGFVISAGTNDFIINYFGPPIRRKSFTVAAYQNFLLQQLQQLIQGLVHEGARKIAVVGLPPIGCLPAVITLHSHDLFNGRGCIESLSSVARDYNRMLQDNLNRTGHGGTQVIYADIYAPLTNIIQGPGNFDVDVVNKGCCGTGLLETSILCNPKSAICSDPSKYVFWDAVHPTEKAYSTIFNSLQSTIDYFLQL
ncbi:Triacylglycerol lipase [Bertholletia excelsa]